MQTVGVIPARGGSVRLGRKNVAHLRGKPLVAHTIHAAQQAAALDRVLVSTDDEEIGRIAVECGAEVVWRPAEFADARARIDDSYRHVLAWLAESAQQIPDVVVGMQANMPIRKPGEIDEIVARLRTSREATAVATAKRITERPEWMKRLADPVTGRLEPWQTLDVSYRSQDFPELYLLDGASIAMRSETLRGTVSLRHLHAYLGDCVLMHVHDWYYAVEVDESFDLQLAEALLASGQLPDVCGLDGASA